MIVIKRGLPFAATWGYHDDEGDLIRDELQYMIDKHPGFVGSRGLAELDGVGNHKLELKKCPGSDETAHNLWFFDSRNYGYLANNGSAI